MAAAVPHTITLDEARRFVGTQLERRFKCGGGGRQPALLHLAAACLPFCIDAILRLTALLCTAAQDSIKAGTLPRLQR